MKVFIGAPRGFCAGVVRAIDIVEIALKRYGAPIYVKHQIVHNQYVVGALEAKGAVTVEDVDDIPEGARVVFLCARLAAGRFCQSEGAQSARGSMRHARLLRKCTMKRFDTTVKTGASSSSGIVGIRKSRGLWGRRTCTSSTTARSSTCRTGMIPRPSLC